MKYKITRYYYIGFNNMQCGPVLREQLVALGVTPDTFVWNKNMKDWRQAKFVEDLNTIWSNRYFNSLCTICSMEDSAICKDCINESLFSLCGNISPKWLMRRQRRLKSSRKKNLSTGISNGVVYGPPTYSINDVVYEPPTTHSTNAVLYGPPPLLRRNHWRIGLWILILLAIVLLVMFIVC